MPKLCPLLIPLCLLFGAKAQIPVDQETHHKVIFENHYFRLLEGTIPIHDTTVAHIHSANSVVLFLSHSTFGIQIVGDTPVVATVNPGDIRFVDYGDKPVTHIVWNQTEIPLHFFVIELSRHYRANTHPLDVVKEVTTHLAPAERARLLITITGNVTVDNTILLPNQYKYLPPATSADLNGEGHCILLEIY